MEKSLLESFFNNVADLKAWNFIKRDSGTGIFLWIFRKFLKSLFTEHLRMTTPVDSSVTTKLLFIDDTLFLFSFIFFLLSLLIATMGVYSQGIWKWRLFYFLQQFLLFT